MNSSHTQTQGKKDEALHIFDPDSVEELLRGWLLHARKARSRHDETARRYDTYRYWLGVPAIVLSALVGTTVFASLGTQPDSSIKILVGGVSIVAAVLTSLQTFYDFANRAERHRAAAVKFKTSIRELEQVLVEPAEYLKNTKAERLNDIRKRLDVLELEAPVIPEGIYNRVQDEYARVKFTEKAEKQ